MKRGKYRVKIREDLAVVREGAKRTDGRVYVFRPGWVMDEYDTSIYIGETAMIPDYSDEYPEDAPPWIASGDLIEVDDDEFNQL